jgi:hypothetical protein
MPTASLNQKGIILVSTRGLYQVLTAYVWNAIQNPKIECEPKSKDRKSRRQTLFVVCSRISLKCTLNVEGTMVMFNTKAIFFLACLWIQPATIVADSPLKDGPWGPTDPVADPAAIVIVPGPSGSHIRLTVLTNLMIRIEQSYSTTSSEATFEDRKTVAVINRKLPVPSFQHSQTNNRILTLQTRCLTLTYHMGEAFSSESLQVTGQMYCSSTNSSMTRDLVPAVAPSWTYNYGDQDPNNLLGTIRTLDFKHAISLNCSERADADHCEWGLVSRSGYAIVNDTLNYALSDERDWWDGPSRDREDLYVLGHGHDYEAALRDYRLIGGFFVCLFVSTIIS